MKITWRGELPQWLTLIVMLAVAMLRWPIAPDRMAAQWKAAGEIDRYGGQNACLLLPLVAAGLYVLLLRRAVSVRSRS